MIWQDFREQAEQDLISCNTLFDARDYGNSAYLLQQGLEKYVKAYIFKFELFVGLPHELRHFPLNKMWDLLSIKLSRKRWSCKKEDRDLITQSSIMFDLIRIFFEKIKNTKDKRWKFGVWKYSLDLTLNQSETGVINQIKNDMEKEIIPLSQKAYELFSERLKMIIANIGTNKRREKFENLVQKLTNMSSAELLNEKKLHQLGWRYVSEKTIEWFDLLQKLIVELLSLADNKEKALQKDFMKIILLAWLFSLRDEIIQTFPHEDLGRYPDTFDGQNSRDIYQKNSLKLDKLIKKVSVGCEKIDQMLDL